MLYVKQEQSLKICAIFISFLNLPNTMSIALHQAQVSPRHKAQLRCALCQAMSYHITCFIKQQLTMNHEP